MSALTPKLIILYKTPSPDYPPDFRLLGYTTRVSRDKPLLSQLYKLTKLSEVKDKGITYCCNIGIPSILGLFLVNLIFVFCTTFYRLNILKLIKTEFLAFGLIFGAFLLINVFI
jgi:hypothetical protein